MVNDQARKVVSVNFPSGISLKKRDKVFIKFRIKQMLNKKMFWESEYSCISNFIKRKINEEKHNDEMEKDFITNEGEFLVDFEKDNIDDDDIGYSDDTELEIDEDHLVSSSIDSNDIEFYLETLSGVDYKKMPKDVYKEFVNIISDDLGVEIKVRHSLAHKIKQSYSKGKNCGLVNGILLTSFIVIVFGFGFFAAKMFGTSHDTVSSKLSIIPKEKSELAVPNIIPKEKPELVVPKDKSHVPHG